MYSLQRIPVDYSGSERSLEKQQFYFSVQSGGMSNRRPIKNSYSDLEKRAGLMCKISLQRNKTFVICFQYSAHYDISGIA